MNRSRIERAHQRRFGSDRPAALATPPPIDWHRSIAWAVALGATTAWRLSQEWGISVDTAGDRLCHAERLGLITRARRGVYASAAPVAA